LTPAVTASLIADFPALSVNRQRDLIENRWSLIRSPLLLPALREIWQSGTDRPLRDAAVRRIYDLAPEEGRAIILKDLASPSGQLSFSTLAMLPDRSLPELNDSFIARLAGGQHLDDVVLRYGTADIVQPAEKAYQRRIEAPVNGKVQCGSALVYYFMQDDPAFGAQELRRQIEAPDAPPVCYDIGFQLRTFSRYAYSEALEKLAIEFLSSPKVPVKRGAAEVLGRFGSGDAQKPLWETLEYFRAWWKGREAELDDGQTQQENVQFERALRIALARADAWVLRSEGLDKLLALCSSKWCRQEVGEWISQAGSPVPIEVYAERDRFRATVAQYELGSEDDLRRKIGQFPAGTVFRVHASGRVEEARRIVQTAGYTVAPEN
jgi:hypothetical protein